MTRLPCDQYSVTNTPPLIMVGMSMAPFPIVPLISRSLVVVCPVSSMVLYQVAPVSMIFAVIPIMVVVMVTIVDSHLYAFLRQRR